VNKLYTKSEIWFSIIWIIIYVLGTSLCDSISINIGIEKVISLPYLLLLSTILIVWLYKNKFFQKYGLCNTPYPLSKYWYFIPLIILISANLWYGVALNLSILETILYILCMLCVGFLEEIIFRGLLFCAMAKDNVRSATIVSSITFGIGHIINLFNSTQADLISNICQVITAIAIGFLFVIIFYRGKTLIPCIITHSIFNALSVFSNSQINTAQNQIIVSTIILILTIGYTLILLNTLPKETNPQSTQIENNKQSSQIREE